MLDTESELAIIPGEAIMKDVDVMWFYPKVKEMEAETV